MQNIYLYLAFNSEIFIIITMTCLPARPSRPSRPSRPGHYNLYDISEFQAIRDQRAKVGNQQETKYNFRA
jgi:hypothetical protein